MSKKSYYEKLKDPRWQKKRLEIMERDSFMCAKCDSKDKSLNVHHGFYHRSYKNPWDYPNYSLMALCDKCHEETHGLLHDVHLEVARIYPDQLHKVLSLLIELRNTAGRLPHETESRLMALVLTETEE